VRDVEKVRPKWRAAAGRRAIAVDDQSPKRDRAQISAREITETRPRSDARRVAMHGCGRLAALCARSHVSREAQINERHLIFYLL